SVLGRGAIPKTRFGTGAILSVVAHAALLAAVLYISTRPHEHKERDVEVTFVMGAPPPPPPPPPPPGGGAPKPEKIIPKETVVKKPDTLYDSAEAPKPRPIEHPQPQPDQGQPGGQPGGVPGGQAGGVVGGQVGGVVGGQLGGQVGGQLG